MKKLLVLILLILFITACSNGSENSVGTSELPKDVQNKILELPENIQQEILVPTEFPTEPDSIEFSYHKGTNEDMITFTQFTYTSKEKGWVIHYTTWHVNSELQDNLIEKMQLENGLEVNVVKNKSPKLIEWKNKNGNIQTLLLVEDPKNNSSEYSIEDLLNVVSSIK